MRKKGSHEPGKRRSLWTVITPEQKATQPDPITGRTPHIPAQAYNFKDKKRAKRFAGNIQGAKMSSSKPRFWTAGRVLLVLALLAIVICALRTR
jgi:hypothetical protein